MYVQSNKTHKSREGREQTCGRADNRRAASRDCGGGGGGGAVALIRNDVCMYVCVCLCVYGECSFL